MHLVRRARRIAALLPFLPLVACGPGGVVPPPGPTAATAPAPADPGASGVSGEVGSGAHGLVTDPYGPGQIAAPLGGGNVSAAPVAGPTPNLGP